MLFALLALPAAAAPSLILSDQPAWNGWNVQSKVKAGFRKAGTMTEVAVNDTKMMSIIPFERIPGEVVPVPMATVSMSPASGATKDKAEGALAFSYRVGSATTEDTFQFSITSTTSAVNAKHDFGSGLEQADAFFESELLLETYYPLTGVTLKIPDMPALTHGATSTEDLLAIIEGPSTGFLHAGDVGYSYPMTLDGTPGGPGVGRQVFRYKLTYSIVTPYGHDPVVHYSFAGGAAGPAAAPRPAPTPTEQSVRAEMPVVKLNRLIYEHGMSLSATVCFKNVADVEPSPKLLLVSPKSADLEVLALKPTGDPKVWATDPIPFASSGDDSKFDNAFMVPPGQMFCAMYAYHLSNRIQADPSKNLKPGDPLTSMDYGIVFDPFYKNGSVTVSPALALSTDEEAPQDGMRRLGTLGVEGLPGIVQIASEDLIFAPASPEQETEFAARTKASMLSDDAAWKGANGQGVWKRYQMINSPANNAEREAKIKYLPQMLDLVGAAGKMHGSNARVLGLFATGLEMWLEGFNCAVNPRMIPHGNFSTPEGRTFTPFEPGLVSLSPNFDSMLSPYNHFEDPRQNQRDLWAECAMQDHDHVSRTVRVAFIDSAFAPNPDFRGYPNAIPEFNMQTGERGPHVAEHPETSITGGRQHVWHGNGTVAVAGGVMGNGYGSAGVAGQIMQPMLYYMGTAQFVFETGQAMELAVADGADIINISAGYPCRILSVLGPIRFCSVEDRAAIAGTIATLVASASGVICGAAPLLDFFAPGLGTFACAGSITAAITAITALFDALLVSTAIGDLRHPMERGVATAKSAGVPVVVSAGNQRQFDWSSLGDLQPLFETENFRTDAWEIIPAVIPDVICVSSTTTAAPYPNTQFFGPAVDLWAPEGQLVLLPHDGADTSPANVGPSAQRLLTFAGSSAAAPFVSGVIAHMMSVNDSMHPHRSTPAETATGVDRILAMLRSSATVPGSAPDVPASSPSNPEIARRGLIVNAHAARQAALRAGGGLTLEDTGFTASYARFDNEAAVANDDVVVETLNVQTTGSLLRFGGLPAGDVDTWRINPPSHTELSEIRVQIVVPLTTGPPPALMNGSTPIPQVSSAAGLALYELQLIGCEVQLLRLSCGGALPPGSSPLRRTDVLYLLNVEYVRTVPFSPPDRFEFNNDRMQAAPLNPADWVAHPGIATGECAAGSWQMIVPNVTLHGCSDQDFYYIPTWPGYSSADTSWGSIRVELDPPVPSASLQFYEYYRDSYGGGRYQPVGEAVSGAAGLDLNPSAHPEARILKVAGTAAGPFSLKISYCQFVDPTVVINPGDVFAHAVGIRSGRIGGAEFWEAMRDARIISAIGPIRFDRHYTCEMVKFPYPRDSAGRSLQGQLFRLKNATTGPIRVLGLPDSGDASIRFDLFDQAGNLVKSAATEDLLGDPLLAVKDTFPQGQPGSLVTLPQPPGTYFLAVSGFHLLDRWTLLFGENQSAPGQLNAEGLGKPDPAPLLDLGNEPAAVSAAFELMGQPFASHILPGQAFVFIPPFGGWRPEYSMDGEHWSEAGPASDAHLFPSFRALVLPGAGGQYGFIRLRDIAAGQDVLSYTAPRPVSFIAAPTEPGHTYSLESSPDLLDWMFEAPVAGDGRVLEWAMPIVAERMFFRVRSE